MNENDEFAAAALTGVILAGLAADPEKAADLAFAYAEAMMRRRRFGTDTPTRTQPHNAAG